MWFLMVPILLLIAVSLIGLAALSRWNSTKSKVSLYTWVTCAILVAIMLFIGYNY